MPQCVGFVARERSDHGFSGESRGGHARRERLPQAGLRGSHRRWAARHSLSGHAGRDRSPRDTPIPERYFSTEWPEPCFHKLLSKERLLDGYAVTQAQPMFDRLNLTESWICRYPPAPNSAPTRSLSRSARVGWVKYTGRATRG